MVQAVDISGALQAFGQLGQSRSVRQQRREQERQQRAQRSGAMVGLLAGGATFAATGNPALAGLAASGGQMAGTTAAGGPAPSPAALGQLGLGVAGVQQQQAAAAAAAQQAALQQQVGQEVGAAISPPAVTPPVQPEQQRFEPLSQAIPGLAPIVPSAPAPVRAPNLPPGAIQGAAPPPNIPAALAAQAKIDPGLALKLAVQREGAGGGAAGRFKTLTQKEAQTKGFEPGFVVQENVETGKFSVAAKPGEGRGGVGKGGKRTPSDLFVNLVGKFQAAEQAGREYVPTETDRLIMADRVTRNPINAIMLKALPGAMQTFFKTPDAAPTFTESSPASPKTSADYNALPKGAFFRDPETGELKQK